jgi:hypothetical protein
MDILPAFGLPVELSAYTAAQYLREFADWEVGVGRDSSAYDRQQNGLLDPEACWKKCDAGFPVVQGGAIKAVATFEADEANFEQRERGLRARHVPTGKVMLFARVPADYGRKARGLWYAEIELVL